VSDCILHWGKSPYPTIHVGKEVKQLSRVLWERKHGPIPTGLYVLHSCDNTRCINEDHFFLGTHGDNMRDMTAKGRRRGAPPHFTDKFSQAQLIAIACDPRRDGEVAKDYGTSRQTVRRIRKQV